VRFAVPEPTCATEEARADFNKQVALPIRLRVVNILKHWVDRHYYDFDADQLLQRRFLHFVDERVRHAAGLETAAVMLRNQMEKRVLYSHPRGADVEMMASCPPPTPLLPKGDSLGGYGLLDLHPVEVARQLTLIESHLFKQIQPKECLNQAWNRPALKPQAPNILNLIDRFNQVSRWVQSEVVHEATVRTRAKVLRRFIEVAWACLQINAFNVIQEIIAALNSAAVGRLKLTWRELKPKTIQLWERVQAALAPASNYKAYRSRIATCEMPCLPYLGVFLSDLTFIEDGNRDRIAVPTPDGGEAELINFVKRRKVAEVIARIRDFQSTPYNFEAVGLIQEVVQTHLVQAQTVWDDEALYAASLRAEPRAPAGAGDRRRSM